MPSKTKKPSWFIVSMILIAVLVIGGITGFIDLGKDKTCSSNSQCLTGQVCSLGKCYSTGGELPVIMNPNGEYPDGTNFKTCTYEKALSQSEATHLIPAKITQFEDYCKTQNKNLVFYETINTATLSDTYAKYPIICTPTCK